MYVYMCYKYKRQKCWYMYDIEYDTYMWQTYENAKCWYMYDIKYDVCVKNTKDKNVDIRMT